MVISDPPRIECDQPARDVRSCGSPPSQLQTIGSHLPGLIKFLRQEIVEPLAGRSTYCAIAALQRGLAANGRYGSGTTDSRCLRHVRYGPESDGIAT